MLYFRFVVRKKKRTSWTVKMNITKTTAIVVILAQKKVYAVNV
jgi:hypothetical protein